MTLKDIVFEPHNDMSVDDAATMAAHHNLIKSGNYSDATNLLDNHSYTKGFRASLFHSIQNKLRELELFLLNEFAAEPDELYSYTDPSKEQMEGKTFWIKPI